MNALIQELIAALPGIPLFGLQAAAVIGMIGAALVMTRRHGKPIVHRKLYIGITLGITAYLIAWFVSDFMKGTVKLNLSIDILILAGVLAGFRGAVIALVCIIVARLQFSGLGNLSGVIVDNLIQLGAGCWLHSRLHPGLLEKFSVRTVWLVWVTRVIATYLGLYLGWLTIGATPELLERFAAVRTIVLPFSFLIIYAALLMAYIDAEIDVRMAREGRLSDGQRAATAAAQESERRFRRLFDMAPVALSLADPAGRVLRNNAHFIKTFGYSVHDMPTIDDWMRSAYPDPEYREKVLQDWNRLLETAHRTGNDVEMDKYRVICRDGETRTVLIGGAQVGDDLLACFQDITEQEKVEAKLRESERTFRTLFERIERISVQGYDEARRVTYWNPASEALYGYRAEEAMGRLLEELILPADMRATTIDAHRRWLTEGIAIPSGELTLVRKDGSSVSVFSSHVLLESFIGREMYCVDVDLTEVRQAHERLKLAASVFTHSREGIVITSPDSKIIDINDRISQLSGYDRRDLLGQPFEDYFLAEMYGAAFRTTLRHDLEQSGGWQGEVWGQRKDGELYLQMLTINAVLGDNGVVQHYVHLTTDVTSLRENERRLQHVAYRDALTGLPNRRALAIDLNQAMQATKTAGGMLAIALCDLDGFKAFNELYGQDVGDRLLTSVVRRVQAVLEEGGLVARVGGDEFAVVLVGVGSIEACHPKLQRLQQAIRATSGIDGVEHTISASVGVTVYPQQQDLDADQLLRQADQAMYQAKQAGRNCYHFFDPRYDSDAGDEGRALDALRAALHRGEFVLRYQPKVDLRSGEVIGCEALIRWQHPERGLLPPAAFLPMIEDKPLAIEMGEWVIDTALTQIELWRASGLGLPISVNIGARQLLQPGFDKRLSSLLDAHKDIGGDCLEIEVLESSALDDLVNAGRVIRACSELGVAFSIDDFGTGYSSLTYLKHLPVEVLKIDQSFVFEALADRNSVAILESVVGLANAFGRRVIAEGVETAEHAELLLRLGCSLAQGYGIARPMPPADMPAWVAAWKPDPCWAAIKTVRQIDRPVLYALVDYRGWLDHVKRHLQGNAASPMPPPIPWARLPRKSRQGDALQAHRSLCELSAHLLALKATLRGQEAERRLDELDARYDLFAVAMIALL